MNNREIIANGVDIVQISRMSDILNKHIRQRFINRVFNIEEINYFEKEKYNPETISGYFAAKEATMKTLGAGIGVINFKDITILKDDNNKPFIKLKGTAEDKANSLGINEILISISHEKEYAIAFTIGIN